MIYSTPQEAMVADLNKQSELIFTLRNELEIAVAALIKARTEVVQYYPPHEYTLEIIDEALKKLAITW